MREGVTNCDGIDASVLHHPDAENICAFEALISSFIAKVRICKAEDKGDFRVQKEWMFCYYFNFHTYRVRNKAHRTAGFVLHPKKKASYSNVARLFR